MLVDASFASLVKAHLLLFFTPSYVFTLVSLSQNASFRESGQVCSWVTLEPKYHEVMIAQFTYEDNSNEKNDPELSP